MNTAPQADILQLFEDAFPKDTIRPNEPYITLSQFRRLLKIYKHPYSKGTLYRWLKVSKDFLPTPVQHILEPAPAVWFLSIPSRLKNKREQTVIPLRYLSEHTREMAQTLAVTKATQSDMVVSLHRLQAHLDIMQTQVTTIMSSLGHHRRKDTPHVQH